MIRAVLAVLAALVLPLATAPAAQAHDVLLESSPVDGARLGAAPGEVTLTFSADLLATGAGLVLTDAAGTTVAETAAEVDGPVATAPLEADLPAGDYTLTWSVVSSDGHRIDGDLGFTVEGPGAEDAPADDTDVQASDGSGQGGNGSGGDGGGNDPGGDQVNNPTGDLDMPGWVMLVLALGALGAAVAIAVRRWRG